MSSSSIGQVNWRVIFCYFMGTLTALPMAAFLLLYRAAPWTRFSVPGFVIAVCMSFGLGYAPAKILLRLPLYRPGFKPAGNGWMDRPWGGVAQMGAIALAGAVLALF